MKNILAVLAGLITATIVFMIFERISSSVFPPPENLDFKNPEALKAYISTLPASALLIVLAGYIAGSFMGGFVVGKVSKSPAKKLTIIMGSILTVSAIVNLIMIPSPVWFMILNLLTYIPCALLGHSLSVPKTVS